VVVAVGLTLVEPPAEEDVNVPGEMATLVAPVVEKASVLLEPEAILAGLAVKELIVGLFPAAATVTVAVATAVTTPPEATVQSVYVVVAVGVTMVEPLADSDLKLIGSTMMPVAPEVLQVSLVLAPDTTLAGEAVKEPDAANEAAGTASAMSTRSRARSLTQRGVGRQSRPQGR